MNTEKPEVTTEKHITFFSDFLWKSFTEKGSQHLKKELNTENQAAFFFKKDVGFVTTFILNLNPINTHTKTDSPLAHCLKKSTLF